MTKDEALTLALEALEAALSDYLPYIDRCKEAITAIKQAQQAQETVEQDRESERPAFEADAEPLGFDLTRIANPNVEPWDDYLEMETGMRWGGWLARAARPNQG